ncbi:MAG: YdcF family protein [Cyanobacteria bacterium P01_D01_bin.128]
MFLFLSKLLPLFVYPLGLACVLLVVALVTLWRKPRWAAGAIAAALLLLAVSGNSGISDGLVRSLEWRHQPLQTVPKAEAIVVLGGGIRSQVAPRPWIEVSEGGDRVLYAARLYSQGKAPVVIMSGGRIAWKDGGPPESSDMATLAVAMGVPKTAILEDSTSLNTYENALNVKQILQAQDIQRVLLVTSAIHMPRSLLIFKKQGIDAIAAPTDYWVTRNTAQEARTPQGRLLSMLPDAEALYRVSRAIKEYIGIVVYRLRGWA